MEKITPVYILSGFLGSGKTTLLQRLIQFWQDQGQRPAVIMNEIGDVNLDGLLVPNEVPMAEMLGGCICCTIRGDLSVQMAELISKEQPDLVVIEATGAGNPLEIFDAVTEVALYLKLEIKPMITVVDAAHLADLHDSQQGKTYRLMLEQIRCGSVLVLNKTDLISEERLREMTDFLRRLNPYANIVPAVKCEVDISALLTGQAVDGKRGTAHEEVGEHLDAGKNAGLGSESDKGHSRQDHDHSHDNHGNDVHQDHQDHDHDHNHDHNHDHSHGHAHQGSHLHASHEHVTVYTHYFAGPVDSEEFERFIKELPREVYRGKGVLTFSDTASRFLFQYAYREADYLKITPQGEVPNVAVFIGEHFDRNWIARKLKELEQ